MFGKISAYRKYKDELYLKFLPEDIEKMELTNNSLLQNYLRNKEDNHQSDLKLLNELSNYTDKILFFPLIGKYKESGCLSYNEEKYYKIQTLDDKFQLIKLLFNLGYSLSQDAIALSLDDRNYKLFCCSKFPYIKINNIQYKYGSEILI